MLFLEEILADGGYYAAVAKPDSSSTPGYFPERSGDGIARDPQGGDGAGSVVPRAPDYGAPVCSHFGDNASRAAGQALRRTTAAAPCAIPRKIQYVDELGPRGQRRAAPRSNRSRSAPPGCCARRWRSTATAWCA